MPRRSVLPAVRCSVSRISSPGSAAASVAPTGELTVAGARWNKKILVVRFDEVTTRNQAEELRGSRLVYEVPEDEGGEEASTSRSW